MGVPGFRRGVPIVAQSIEADWVSRFGVGLEVLRFGAQEGLTQSVRAIEARRLAAALMDRVRAEGLPRPSLDAVGEEFAVAFDRWVVDLVSWLRSPTRS